VNINQGRGLQITQSVEDTHVILTPVNLNDQQESSSMSSFVSTFRFEERLRLLETSFNEYRQTNQVAGAVSAIPGIVHQYIDQQMKEAVRETTCQMEETLLSMYETGADEQPIVQTSHHPEWFSQPRKPP
nr:hypothetical protein [Tanacetum cinerariifolium]